jgi:hypothetical protein
LKQINKRVLIVFLIFLFLVGFTSYNITQNWVRSLLQGIVAGVLFSLTYIVGYSYGVEEGDRRGYDRAWMDLKPILPPDENVEFHEQK